MKNRLEKLTRYFSEKGPVILLESQSNDHPWSQKSYLAALPKAEIKARDNHIMIVRGGKEEHQTGNPWEALQQFRREYNDWIFGYLGYDLKNHLEKLESQNLDQVKAPDLYFMVPGLLLEIDHKQQTVQTLIGSIPEGLEREETDSESDKFWLGNVDHQTSRAEYLAKIRMAQEHILEGDFYEVNLSHQMKGDFKGSPFALYKRMKEVGPVPFSVYLDIEDVAICCQSPERFLRKEGATVFSQPIKGTSQRGHDFAKDEKLKQGLIASEKERAENLMIVDLVRNDLSRIAKRGSVKVPELFSIQSFETVHQMVSTVTAEAEEQDPVEILKACFPMGSMTGAPKISAMETIEALEDYRRGIYSGAIGYITPEDDFDFNVVIRTAIIRDDTLFYSVGGAITSDSDPGREWEETQVKACALLDALSRSEVA